MTQDEIIAPKHMRESRERLERVVHRLAVEAQATGRGAAAVLLAAIGESLSAQGMPTPLQG